MSPFSKILCFTLAPILIVIITISSCRKTAGKPGFITVRLTDRPASEFSEVNIEVKKVELHYANKTGKYEWVELETKSGTYDLLSLRNNMFTTLVNKDAVPPGKITQARLILGSQNSVITPTGAYSLVIPSALRTGIKINLVTEIEQEKTTIIGLDFDAQQSVSYNKNGYYTLSPVIKVASVTAM
jgi:hypothetical protein